MALSDKARRLLRKAFPRPDHVSVEVHDGGIIGLVRSPKFRGVDFIDRQKMISAALDDQLPPEERRRIAIIVAVTPEEEMAHLSG